MNRNLVMRRASIQDLGTVMGLLDQRINWLRQRGTDQWSTRSFNAVMTEAITRGETWLLWDDAEAIATITLTTTADQDFWSYEERRTPAFYISKLATSLKHQGLGLGTSLIDWATTYATARGVLWLRWDVWRTNERLQTYYRSLGATHLRTLNIPGRNSGALFELSRAAQPDLGITTAAAFEPVLTLASTETAPAAATLPADVYGYAGVDSAGNQIGHEYVRLVDHWRTSSPFSRDLDDPAEFPVSVSQHNQPVLFDPGDGWHLMGAFSKPIENTWPATLDPTMLRRSQVYRLRLSSDLSKVELFGDVDR